MYLKRLIGVKILTRSDTDKIMENVRKSWSQTIVYKLGSQFLIDRDFPLHLYFELSRLCNYNCPMCMRREAPSGGHFPVELAKKITNEAAKKGPTSYSLHLYGEPLINPEWADIVAVIRRAHSQNTILLTTNGFFLNENASLKLIELGVNRIFVSLHSLDPNIYKTNTGGGDISIVLNNIRTFAKLAGPSSRTKIFVRLFHGPDAVIHSSTQLDTIKQLRANFEVRGYHNFAGGKNNWTTFKNEKRRWPCYHPWFTLGIAVDGTSVICCADAQLRLKVGNAYEQPIEDMWKSSAVKSMRIEHLRNHFKNWKTCEFCDTWQFHPDIFFIHQKTDRT